MSPRIPPGLGYFLLVRPGNRTRTMRSGKLSGVSTPRVTSIVKDPKSTYSVLFEDDGKVAYAYLRDGARVVADVWIYNCGDAPETPEWKLPDARSRLPFTNPRGYVRDEPRPVVRNASDIGCRWINDVEASQLLMF